MVDLPEPTIVIFASVFAEISGLNAQKTQVRKVGTLTKNFLYYLWVTAKLSKPDTTFVKRNENVREVQDSDSGKCW